MFWFDFNWQIQSFLNQFWWQINFLLLAVLVILGYLSYKKTEYAVGLTIILLPTYLFRSEILGIPLTFLELCILITFAGWFIKSIQQKKAKACFQCSYHWPVVLILVTASIGLFIAPNLRVAGGIWKAYFVEPILFFLVITKVWQLEKNKKIILWSLGISTLSISLLAIFQKFTGFGIAEAAWVAPANRRVTSIFTSPNAIGLYLGPIVAIYLGWLMAEIKSLKPTILKMLILTPALLAILFTVSQGTWLGLVAAGIFLAYFGWNKKWTTIIIATIIILIIIIPLTRNVLGPIITLQDAAGQNRLGLIEMSQQHLFGNIKNFIFGAGLFGFAEIQNQMREPLKMEALLYPHNIFFNFWLEIGLLGLISFGWLVAKFFKQNFKKIKIKKDWLTLGILAAMIVIIVHGLVDVPYFKNDLAILFWLIVGLV